MGSVARRVGSAPIEPIRGGHAFSAKVVKVMPWIVHAKTSVGSEQNGNTALKYVKNTHIFDRLDLLVLKASTVELMFWAS
ncbi:hypothetical protein [Roseomonas sp. 18066]|uniref:hypothetical protein n=1 Tax=Roseomonas sp. 18066 TaxID=2681412 RepID=UPI00135865BA|nr:hypothetical protein [Roseomonas sp. 18066]